MRSRILKRPMFRMGGDVENMGIMDGMRNRYREPVNAPVGSEKDSFFQRALATPGVPDLLISGGLDLLSRPPRGGTISTVAQAFQNPFQRFQDTQARQRELAGDRAFKERLLDKQLAAERDIAMGKKEDRQKEALIKAYLPTYDNDFTLAEARAEYELETEKVLATSYGAERLGTPLDFDVNSIEARKQFVKANKANVGKFFYNLLDKQTYKLVDTEDGRDLVPVSTLDTEGDTLPEEEKTTQKTYAERVGEDLAKIREEKRKELEKRFAVEDDVDI